MSNQYDLPSIGDGSEDVDGTPPLTQEATTSPKVPRTSKKPPKVKNPPKAPKPPKPPKPIKPIPIPALPALPVSQIHRIMGEGPIPSPIMIVGHRPGKDEARLNRVFVGATGRELDRYLNRANLLREHCYLTNLCKDFRDGHPMPTKAEVLRDEGLLLSEIGQCQPNIIVALGVETARYFLGPDIDIDAIHGIPHTWEADSSIIILPCYHPAAGLYSPDQMALIQDDINQIGRVLAGQSKPRQDEFPDPRYSEAPDPTQYVDWDYYVQITGCKLCAIDTEGWRDNPWSLQFTSYAGWGFVVRPISESSLVRFRTDLEEFIADGGLVLLHNAMHDLEVLRHLGIDLPPGSYVDTMVMAYLLQLEPRGLKALAYRHAGMVMQEYDELMDEAGRNLALQYLLTLDSIDWGPTQPYKVMQAVKEPRINPVSGQQELTGKGKPKVRYLGMKEVIKSPWPLNKRIRKILDDYANKDGSNNSGVEGVVDLRKRWSGVLADNPELKGQIEAKVGPIPRPTLDDIEYGKAIHYAARDSDATLRIYPVLKSKIEAPAADGKNLVGILAIDMAVIPMLERMQYIGMPADRDRFKALGVTCQSIMDEERAAIERITGAQINPDSAQQTADLLYDQLELPLVKRTKSGEQGKTDDKTLEGMSSLHPVIPHITAYRGASKVKSSFVDPLPRLLERDERIHCTIRSTNVVSGRISAADPNLTALPVREELGRQVRSCFVAPEGHVLGGWDLDQIEMREMAHQSRDPLMIKYLSDPKYDIHCETAAKTFGLHINERADNKQERYLNIDSMKHRLPAKRVGFGVITGITGIGLKLQMDLSGGTKNGQAWTEQDCDKLIMDYLDGQYPGVRAYLAQCKREAHHYGFVRCRYGRIRHLPAVYSDKFWVREEAERQSHSHKISASAQGLLKRAMALIHEFWIHYRYTEKVWIEPMITIHDELIFECEENPKFQKEWDQVVMNAMCSADSSMRVPIRAKGTWGRDWGMLKD